MKHTLTLSLALSLLSGAALAQTAESNRLYGTLGYSRVEDGDFKLGAVTGRLGVQFTPYLGAEAEASFGVKGDRPQVSAGGDIRHKLEYDAAVYAVGRLPLGERFALLGRVGYGATKTKNAGVSSNVSRDRQGLGYGLGAQFDLDDHNGLRADWTRRAVSGDDADLYSISYTRRF